MVANRQRGFSLIELMIAMVLGLMIVAAVLQTFLAGKRSYEMQEDLSRIQENGRFAMEFLKKDIRQAGFWGCLTDPGAINNHLNDQSINPLFGFTGTVSGSEGSGYVATFSGQSVVADSILIGGGDIDSRSPIRVTRKKSPNPSESTQISKGSGIKEGDIFVISDCKTADILQATNVNTSNANFDSIVHNTAPGFTPGNNKDVDMSKDYHGAPISNLFKLSNRVYTVAKSGTSNEPALYRNGEELVEGIESMQLLYGVASGGVISYLPADSADMDQVVSVQVNLLLRGFADNVTDQAVTVDYDNRTLTADDRRLRKVFTSTVALRNRLN